MSKNILVISSSLRRGSNSDALADEFVRGAQDAGHTVEKISLAGKTLGFCRGCLACQELGRCVIDDDANAIMQKILAADAVAFATPIYYYEMSGQLKTLLDRLNPMFPLDYKFREAYLLCSATEDESSTPERAISGFEGWVECFEKCRLAGTVFAGGVTAPGEISGHPALKNAYSLGLSVGN